MNMVYSHSIVFFFFFLYTSTSAQQLGPFRKINLSKDSPTNYKPGVLKPELVETLDGENHPCHRPCNGKPMTCHYLFNVEWYESMSKACYNCPFNAADCERKDCVVANGMGRPIIVVNRKMPGPSIEVCLNDKIVVKVTNELMGSGTAIHWHGMRQVDSPYMDGVPFVTQCPINPESSFTYKFTAAQAGTHFWHSHIGMQRGDGVYGALIIREPKIRDVHRKRYDYDGFVMQIDDWNNQMAVKVFTGHFHSGGSNTPSALLINGRGRFNVTDGNRTTMTEAPRFTVSKYSRYRFRLINAGFYSCPVELTVDGHNITVIASDGYDLAPVTAKSLVSYAGERFDFIIDAYQKTDNYWIKLRGLLDCANLTQVRQVAVLHYDGADNGEPTGELIWEESRVQDNMELNTENKGDEQHESKTISMLSSVYRPQDDILKPTPDYKFYVAYDFNVKNNDRFNKDLYYDHNQVMNVNKKYSSPLPQLNHITMKLPNSPLLVTRPSADNFCNESSIAKTCNETFCHCHHVLSVELNSVVELVIVDEGFKYNANHPFHLHGYNFRVIGQRRLGFNVTVEEVQALDAAGKLTRNLEGKPPIKDTVTIPDGGYTIIRFKADNPGYWLFHCHIEFHAEVGMALAFKVGEHKDMKPVPKDFPTCGDYKNDEDNTENMVTSKSISKSESIIVNTHSSAVIGIANVYLSVGLLFISLARYFTT